MILALAAHADRIVVILGAARPEDLVLYAVINGPFASGWFPVDARDLAARRMQPASGNAKVVRPTAWDAIPVQAWHRIYQSSGRAGLSLAHARLLKAAAMLRLGPESVHLQRKSDDDFPLIPGVRRLSA